MVGATVGYTENTTSADVIVNDVGDDVTEEFTGLVNGSIIVIAIGGRHSQAGARVVNNYKCIDYLLIMTSVTLSFRQVQLKTLTLQRLKLLRLRSPRLVSNTSPLLTRT